MTSALYDLLATKAGADDIDSLEAAVNEIFERILDADPDPVNFDTGETYTVSQYLAEPCQQFVAERAVAGVPLPQNRATAIALVGACSYLESFYEAELKPRR